MPGLGCNGCIQEAEAFMKTHVTDKRILFVLTNLSSLKILQLKIGIKIDEHDNILVDKNGLFEITTNNRIYPCIIEMKEGKVVSHSFQSPRNEAFFKWEMNTKK